MSQKNCKICKNRSRMSAMQTHLYNGAVYFGPPCVFYNSHICWASNLNDSLGLWRGFWRHTAGGEAVHVYAMSNQRMVSHGRTHRPQGWLASTIQWLDPPFPCLVCPSSQRHVSVQRHTALLAIRNLRHDHMHSRHFNTQGGPKNCTSAMSW